MGLLNLSQDQLVPLLPIQYFSKYGSPLYDLHFRYTSLTCLRKQPVKSDNTSLFICEPFLSESKTSVTVVS